MAKRNFLLGKGERLAENIKPASRPMVKAAPYTFDEAKVRLGPMLLKVAAEIENLPKEACPDDLAVATFTMNPEYIAKSYFPGDLLRSIGLRAVGSRAQVVTPEKKSGGRESIETLTTELFVVGKRPNFQKWAASFSSLTESEAGASQIKSIERISFQKAPDKLKVAGTTTENSVYEIVLHVDEQQGESRYLDLFRKYLFRRDLTPLFKRRFYAGGLCFVELEAPQSDIDFIAGFSLVRLVRSMPTLRLLRPAIRAGKMNLSLKVRLRDETPLDPKIKVALFDGGIPAQHPILKWTNYYDTPELGATLPELLEHGVGVTSAFLFGHIDPRKEISRPYAYVDHYRVLDDVPGKNPYELFEILDRIKDVLETTNYDFINLSLGPQLPIDDDDVHAWTAILDDYLSKHRTLATIAVGNDGEGDPSIGANRIQVPADCVNALGIGACDVPDDNWLRASYSSIGPGRSPGLVKPDLVDFGGSDQRLFLTLDAIDPGRLLPTGGTSFAAPAVLRLASGIKAHFGNALSPLAIRGLLIHCAESCDIPKEEIGFGRVARTLDDMVICPDTTMRVVFQGRITASKYIRIPIPVPLETILGKLTIKATLCYTTEVDPHHPENYTRSGLEVSFRPDKTKFSIDKKTKRQSTYPASKPFFNALQNDFATEQDLRRDAQKWENCLNATKRFFGTSLKDPAFYIHFNARSEGHNDNRAQEIEYAMVITVEAPKVSDLYNKVVRRYATILEQLTPIIDIPVRV